MIEVLDLAECSRCNGTGKVVAIARGVARAFACPCQAGRALAFTPMPVLRTTLTEQRKRRA